MRNQGINLRLGRTRFKNDLYLGLNILIHNTFRTAPDIDDIAVTVFQDNLIAVNGVVIDFISAGGLECDGYISPFIDHIRTDDKTRYRIGKIGRTSINRKDHAESDIVISTGIRPPGFDEVDGYLAGNKFAVEIIPESAFFNFFRCIRNRHTV